MKLPSYVLLIPSRGRPKEVRKFLERHPFIADIPTFIGLETSEVSDYLTECHEVFKRVIFLSYRNTQHSCGFAREQLRKVAMADPRKFEYFITGDDNMRLESSNTLANLVAHAKRFPRQPCVVSGLSGFKRYFDRNRPKTDVVSVKGPNRWPETTSFVGVGMILMCIPRVLYESYEYPADMFAMEDRHLILSSMARGCADWRICIDAVFDKRRHQQGGQGSSYRRQYNQGRGYARLAEDFPFLLGSKSASPPMRWSKLLATFRSSHSALATTRKADLFDQEVTRLTTD